MENFHEAFETIIRNSIAPVIAQNRQLFLAMQWSMNLSANNVNKKYDPADAQVFD
jgi:hypothetical protein